MLKALAVVVLAVPTTIILGVAVLAGGDTEPPPPPAGYGYADIPADLLPVYQAAAQRCTGLPWQIVAAIGHVETRHAQHRANSDTGDVDPPIVGPPLDGSNGTRQVKDADEPDGWAHAHGPMQFLKRTWNRYAVLAPGRPADATPSYDNAWDSIHAAARLLCGDQPEIHDLRAAVRRYNHSDTYVDHVFNVAADYGYTQPQPE
jgi:membrane-bound lytic murein transglycosylase B